MKYERRLQRLWKLLCGQVPDKKNAWQDLIRLSKDKDSDVRESAAEALETAIRQVPDKVQVWRDLIRLTQDKNRYVQLCAANNLGIAFSQVPDKEAAWQDLIRLTQDLDRDARMYAYHTLGSASVYKATETTNDDASKMELELKNAIANFEKSYLEGSYGPANFCYPFWKAYHAIVFQEPKKEEIQRYLAEAKKAVRGSEAKDELLKAIENLDEAHAKPQ